MAKRYYLAKLIGTGAQPQYDDDGNLTVAGDPFRTALHDVPGVNLTVTMPGQDPQTGAFRGQWCLVLASTVNHAQIVGTPDVFPLPDVGGLDVDWSTGVSAGARNDAEARITAAGFTKGWKLNARYGEVLRSIGRQIDAAFREDNFDVSE